MTDSVNHPAHYTHGNVECIDAIEAALTTEEFAGFCKGNALKYTWRSRHKGGIEDLRKAGWYLDRVTNRCDPDPYSDLPYPGAPKSRAIQTAVDSMREEFTTALTEALNTFPE